MQIYLKALDLFDAENTRFWIRVNVFVAIQLIVIAGILANLREVLEAPLASTWLAGLAGIFSVFTSLVIWRSGQVNAGMLAAIKEIELEMNGADLLARYLRNSRAPVGVIVRYCLIMSLALNAFWLALIGHFMALRM